MDFADYLASRKRLYTGRASAAIYLILRANRLQRACVLVPANICYAAVLPIVYSGNEPVFADVGEDGNLTSATVAEVLTRKLKAAIIPHMYGNPCLDTPEICKTLLAQGTVVIEDCASAMGAEVSGAMTGTFGDYAVYSFGHSKTIDCGHGGLIVSRRDLDDLAAINAELPLHGARIDQELELLSRIYRLLRNSATSILCDAFYKCICRHMQHCFIFKASSEQIARLSAGISKLNVIIDERRRNAMRYEDSLEWNAQIRRYTFHKGAVPWRYNVLIDETRRPALIAELLRRMLPVSDWYPVVAPMFGMYRPFPQAHRMERQILNFPVVDVTEDQIQVVTSTINKFFAGG